MIKWVTKLFSKKDKKTFDKTELDCFKFGPYAEEIEHLKFKLRRAEGCIDHLNERLDHAHEIMQKECVGVYKYLETPETKLKERISLLQFSIEHRADMAVDRIHRFAGLPLEERPEKRLYEDTKNNDYTWKKGVYDKKWNI